MHLWTRAVGHMTSLHLPGLVQSSLFTLISQNVDQMKDFRYFLKTLEQSIKMQRLKSHCNERTNMKRTTKRRKEKQYQCLMRRSQPPWTQTTTYLHFALQALLYKGVTKVFSTALICCLVIAFVNNFFSPSFHLWALRCFYVRIVRRSRQRDRKP